jgi:hypothetical protein
VGSPRVAPAPRPSGGQPQCGTSCPRRRWIWRLSSISCHGSPACGHTWTARGVEVRLRVQVRQGGGGQVKGAGAHGLVGHVANRRGANRVGAAVFPSMATLRPSVALCAPPDWQVRSRSRWTSGCSGSAPLRCAKSWRRCAPLSTCAHACTCSAWAAVLAPTWDGICPHPCLLRGAGARASEGLPGQACAYPRTRGGLGAPTRGVTLPAPPSPPSHACTACACPTGGLHKCR